jgi:DNA phosphorothioation-dependent restriction protein DptG
MGKKKKKPVKNLVKKVKKVIVQHGSEMAIGLATGIVTNFITDASERFIQSRKKTGKR